MEAKSGLDRGYLKNNIAHTVDSHIHVKTIKIYFQKYPAGILALALNVGI